MGGNVLIITGSQSTNITFIRNGSTVGAQNVGMTGLKGFAVLAK